MGSCKDGFGSLRDNKRFQDREALLTNNYNGHLVYCKTNRMKTFDRNKVYEIESLNSHNIKIKEYKRSFDPQHFDFIENNEALFRQYQMNSVLDIDELIADKSIRKIDRQEDKVKLLTKFLINKLNTNVNSGKSIDCDTLISETVKTNKARYEVTTEDFKFIENLTFKELIDILN
jgi:hypothetical protein